MSCLRGEAKRLITALGPARVIKSYQRDARTSSFFPIAQEESHGLSHLLPVSTMTHTFQVYLDGHSDETSLGPLSKDLNGVKVQVAVLKEEQ